MWVQAEVIAMSTDIAEFLGAALGLNLLFGVPLLVGRRHDRLHRLRRSSSCSRAASARFELAITALLGIIFLGFLYETLKIGPSAHGSPRGLVPAPRRHRARSTSRSGSSARP